MHSPIGDVESGLKADPMDSETLEDDSAATVMSMW
jgi:hypothetical protein